MEKKTPLYDIHVKAGGKMVPFAGYLLPMQYQGVIKEHMAVRRECGIFDVSHMGEILCTGPDALENLNRILTNDYRKMTEGQARYSPMCNSRGGVVDDLIVYKVREQRYMLVVNAANKDKDLAWLQAHRQGNASFEDISGLVAQIALQGPKAGEILEKLVPQADIPQKYNTCKFDRSIQGMKCIISKTGYTGEDGYEFYMSAQDAPDFWELLTEAGKPEGLIPCGLGARDTLRLEAGMPLYGHEMREDITPFEAGLGSFVKMEKEDFIGKEALEKKGLPSTCRIGLKAVGRGIIREGMEIFAGEERTGWTTSGTHCPYLGYPAAMAIVEKRFAKPGTVLEAEVRGRRVQAEVVRLPFYKKKAE